MFASTFAVTQERISVLRQVIRSNSHLRELLSCAAENCIGLILPSYPSFSDWKIHEHCSVLTRLYAIYASFVEKLISEMLAILPTICEYQDLDDSLRIEHRNGVARVLQRIDRPMFCNLTPEQVVRDYYEALSGVSNYRIIPQAILNYDHNLRLNVLLSLFDKAGLKDFGKWLEGQRDMKDYLEKTRGDQTTAEAELNSFVGYRNEAAHGYVTEVLGTDTLLDLCSFVEVLCLGIYEFVNHWVICKQLEHSKAQIIGEVTEKFSGTIIVAKIQNANLAVGESLFFTKDQYCAKATIESIQINDLAQSEIAITSEQEVGLKTSIQVRKKARIVKMSSHS